MANAQHSEPGFDAPSWDDALATVLAAKQALRDAEASPEENDATNVAILEASDDLLGPLDQLIIGMPSPSGDALATKVELFIEFDDLARGDPGYDLDAWTKAIDADAQRLTVGVGAGEPLHPPVNWDSVLAAYDAAEKRDAEYCGAVWNPAYDIATAGGPKIPDDIEAHMQSIMDVCKAAETVLMNIPSATPQQTLLKLLIALGNGRECFGYLPTILTEAENFTGRTAQ